MAQVPANLLSLHGAEEEIRLSLLRMIDAQQDLSDHLEMTERSMDVIDMLRQHYQNNDDERTIVLLGIRAFNGFATAWKLVASGYYQAATLILRDIVETTNLVNAFHVDRTRIAKWRNADRRTLKRDFGPAAVRKILDEDAGLGKSRREEIYIKFSTLAGHPTLHGFAMLRPQGMDALIGPFSDTTALRAVLEEMGMLASQAGFAFGVCLDTTQAGCKQLVHQFLIGAMNYSGRYLGRIYSLDERKEVDRLFA